MSNKFDPVNERTAYRGVDYELVGGYANAEHTAGNFAWRHRWGQGVAGDEQTARREVQRTIDSNLDANDEPLIKPIVKPEKKP